MARAVLPVLVALGFGLVLAERGSQSAVSAAESDPHAYFDALTARNDHWKSFSLRTPEQVQEYKAANSLPASVTYDPANDPHPRRQDAAKVEVPTWLLSGTLALPVAEGDFTVTLEQAGPAFVKNSQLLVDNEIMNITGKTGNVLTVTRGFFGRPIASHQAGAPVSLGNLSLPNQVWLPLNTEDGHVYLATWDAWYSEDLASELSGLKNWKTFQFDAPKREGGGAGIWFEVRTRFDLAEGPNELAWVDARTYGTFGPNVTANQPLSPAAGTFSVRPNTWVRYWVMIEQRASDWDLMSLWVADENTGPVQIIDKRELEAFTGITQFRLEYNTSTYSLPSDRGSLVGYFRNFAVLRDVGDPTPLFVRPLAGPQLAALPESGPRPPSNVRIVD